MQEDEKRHEANAYRNRLKLGFWHFSLCLIVLTFQFDESSPTESDLSLAQQKGPMPSATDRGGIRSRRGQSSSHLSSQLPHHSPLERQ